ncbi:MAG: hypothetical protein JSR24_15605 [Proteobacteria bacterium]|nr:hypothetical protein [Pseudomonadota bacterium]
MLVFLAVPTLAASASRPVNPPAVRSGKAAEVFGTYVVLEGWIDPRGQVTRYYFELGTTESYGISPELNDEHPIPAYRRGQVIEAIPGLRPRTTYHFRLVAHSRGGTTYGKDKTFRTRRSDG